MPAVTRNTFGDGVAYYLGTRPEACYTELFLARTCANASFLFVLNHNEEAVEVEVERPVLDLLAGVRHNGMLGLGPFGAAVLREG